MQHVAPCEGTLRNGERERNENVEGVQGCDTKERRERERNGNVEGVHGCDTKERRERGMKMLRGFRVVTLRNGEDSEENGRGLRTGKTTLKARNGDSLRVE